MARCQFTFYHSSKTSICLYYLFIFYIFIIVTGNTFTYIYKFQIHRLCSKHCAAQVSVVTLL